MASFLRVALLQGNGCAAARALDTREIAKCFDSIRCDRRAGVGKIPRRREVFDGRATRS
jgi:hypothetical protein